MNISLRTFSNGWIYYRCVFRFSSKQSASQSFKRVQLVNHNDNIKKAKIRYYFLGKKVWF